MPATVNPAARLATRPAAHLPASLTAHSATHLPRPRKLAARLNVAALLCPTLLCATLLCAALSSLPAAAQQTPRPLPQASPGANYAAQLAIPPGLGYPFAMCELQGQAPRWLKLDCARLQLTGKVPAAPSDSTVEMTLQLKDHAGNARAFPLSLRISATPQMVSLEEPPPTLASTPPPTPATQVSAAAPAVPVPAPTQVPATETPASVDQPKTRTKYAPTLRNAALTETKNETKSLPADADPPSADPQPAPDEASPLAAAAAELPSAAAAVTKPAKSKVERKPAVAAPGPKALPVAAKGFPYEVALKISSATTFAGKVTYELQSGSAPPAGIDFKDADSGPTLVGTPSAKTISPQVFTIVLKEDGTPKLDAAYSLEVDDPPSALGSPTANTKDKPVNVINPIVIGQGYAESLTISKTQACLSYSINWTEADLSKWGLSFPSEDDREIPLLSSKNVTDPGDDPLPEKLEFEVTCQQKSQAGPVTARFEIQVEKSRPVVSASGVPDAAATAPTTDFDLGLTRYYFLGGTVLSQQQNQFSHTDLFLGFHLDRVFRAPGPYVAGGPDWEHLIPGISSLLDIRMTSLPVAVQPCSPTSSTSSSSSSTSTNCSNTSTGSSTTSSGDQTQVFLNSQKSARFEGGVYMPFQLRHWTVASTSAGKPSKDGSKDGYVVDFAPIAKIGFDTSLNGLNQTQQASNTPSTVQPTGNSNSFYKFWDYGGRLVWSKIPADKADNNQAPDLTGYIDIGIGRFSNLATLLCPKAQAPCTVPSLNLNHQFQYRIPMEGALEVPGAKGLTIGFSANLSQRGIGAHHYDLLPPDDLRFLFGYKVDVTKFFKNVFPQ